MTQSQAKTSVRQRDNRLAQACLAVLVVWTLGSTTRARAAEPPVVAVIVGAAGLPEYEEQFREWAQRWQQAAEQADTVFVMIGGEKNYEVTDRGRLEALLTTDISQSDAPLWLVMIGHGTYFRETANFNLQGPDVSSKELALWLDQVPRPLVVVNCSSSSGPFIRDLATPGRVIVTATQSGAEQNYARFGDFMSAAMTDASADLDHDKQVSLLEAFLSASGHVAQFYKDESRLATEHALLEDNGDGLGTPASFFRGARAVRAASGEASPDGRLAARIILIPGEEDFQWTPAQQKERERIEQEIDRLRDVKATLEEDDYYKLLEPLMVQLARLYETAEDSSAVTRSGAPPDVSSQQ